ncbi:hypothetical protein [Pedobacter gandavensis]|uniref:hypothetical protein n=1 Tax=Pedobacter gandavensis TaxID=2679963 RepID=UPI00292D815E|nr:hypothetical protein [Pedobacter gandavensis]
MTEGILIAIISAIGLIGVALISRNKRETNNLLEEESIEISKADGSTHKKSKKRYK